MANIVRVTWSMFAIYPILPENVALFFHCLWIIKVELTLCNVKALWLQGCLIPAKEMFS